MICVRLDKNAQGASVRPSGSARAPDPRLAAVTGDEKGDIARQCARSQASGCAASPLETRAAGMPSVYPQTRSSQQRAGQNGTEKVTAGGSFPTDRPSGNLRRLTDSRRRHGGDRRAARLHARDGERPVPHDREGSRCRRGRLPHPGRDRHVEVTAQIKRASRSGPRDRLTRLPSRRRVPPICATHPRLRSCASQECQRSCSFFRPGPRLARPRARNAAKIRTRRWKAPTGASWT